MRIGILCGEYPPCNHGGIGTFTKDLAEGLTRLGHEIVVFGIYYDMYLKIEERVDEIINNVNVIRLPFRKYTWNSYLNEILNRIFLHRFAERLISEKSLDLIETYDSTGMMPFKLSIPKISRLHGTVTFFGRELGRPYSSFISYFEKSQINKSDLIIGVSKYVLVKSLEYFHVKVKATVVYNSIRMPEKINFQNLNIGRFILYFGSIIPKKGVEQLIRAMNLVFRKFPEIYLVMVGKTYTQKDGIKYTEYLRKLLLQEYQSNLRIINHQSKNELYNYIINSYCCIFPSFSECFALAPMEAMALGKPVIFSALHSGPELISDGIDGLLVDPNNVEQIADRIIYLIENPDFASKIGINGQNTIKTRFNYENWLEENVKIYESIINKS